MDRRTTPDLVGPGWPDHWHEIDHTLETPTVPGITSSSKQRRYVDGDLRETWNAGLKGLKAYATMTSFGSYPWICTLSDLITGIDHSWAFREESRRTLGSFWTTKGSPPDSVNALPLYSEQHHWGDTCGMRGSSLCPTHRATISVP